MMRGSPRQVSPFAFFCGADLVDDLGVLAMGTGVSPYGQNIHRGAIDRIGRPSPRFRKRIGLEPMNLAAIDDVSAYSTNDGAAARSKTVPAGRDRHYVPHPLYR